MHQKPKTLREAIVDYLATYDDRCGDPTELIAITQDLAPEDDRPIAEAARKFAAYYNDFSTASERAAARDGLRTALNAKYTNRSRLVRAVQAWIDAPAGDRAMVAWTEIRAAIDRRQDPFAVDIRKACSVRSDRENDLKVALARWVDADGNERGAPLTLAEAVQEYLTAYDENRALTPRFTVMVMLARGLDTPLAVAVRRFETATGTKVLPELANLSAALGVDLGRVPQAADAEPHDLDTAVAKLVERREWGTHDMPEWQARFALAVQQCFAATKATLTDLLSRVAKLDGDTAGDTVPHSAVAAAGDTRSLFERAALRHVTGDAETLEAAAEAFLAAQTGGTAARLRRQVDRPNAPRVQPLYRACYTALSRPAGPTADDLARIAATLEGMRMTVEEAALGLLAAYEARVTDTAKIIPAYRRAFAACVLVEPSERDALWHTTFAAARGCLRHPGRIDELRDALGILTPSDGKLLDAARRAGARPAALDRATELLRGKPGDAREAVRALLTEIGLLAGELP